MRLRPATTAVLSTLALGLASLQFASQATAVAAPGAPSPAAASLNGMSQARLSKILSTDHTAHLDKSGHLYYVEPAIQGPVGATQPRRAAAVPAVSLAIPALHSRPTSTHVIFLDFGPTHLASTSAWTTEPTNPIPAGNYTGFSLDGDPTTYTQTEVDYITKVWRIVSEKYSPFDVDVTTVDPGAAAYSRTSAGDVNYGDHVVITSDPAPVNAGCGGGCAGIAYVGTFDTVGAANYAPIWVFASQTFGSAQLTAHDAAHEVGHSFGLSHDGTNAMGNGSYYAGQGNWAPIMGLDDQNAVYQFSKGEYADANNTEDDLAIIGANGNSGAANSLLLPDDYTTSAGAPTGAAVLGDQTSYALDGVISNAADDDLFSIDRTCTSALTATATGIGAGQSLDMKVDILDTSNTVLATNDPASGQDTGTQPDGDIGYLPTGLDASATLASTTAGTTYRIRVDGVGHGNVLTTGYTDYGSIGQYHLVISGCPATVGTIPGAPATASATPNPRTTTGTVNWTAPSSNGGSAITGYQLTGLPGGTVNVGNVLTYNATGLVPGTTYSVAVFAKNAVGTSASAATTSLTVLTWAPTTKPGLTTSLSGATATVSWTAPANPGGATLTGWHVVGAGATFVDENLSAGTLTKNYVVGIGSTSFTVTGTYTASDTAGIVASDPKSVAYSTVAQAPATASATPISRTSTGTLQWTAPSDTGGSQVTGYQLTGLPSGSAVNLASNVLTYVVTGATPGSTYMIDIRAVNKNGNGIANTVSLRVDTWVPSVKPTLTATVSGQNATLTWSDVSAANNPGKAVRTGWKVELTHGSTIVSSTSVSAATLTKSLTGLPIGSYTATLTPTYTAEDQSGLQSGVKTFTIAVKPSAPGIGTAVSGAAGGTKTATAKWAAPTSDGGAAITSYKVIAYKVVKGKVTRTYTSTARPGSSRSFAFALPTGTYKFRVVAYNRVGASPVSGYSKVVTAR